MHFCTIQYLNTMKDSSNLANMHSVLKYHVATAKVNLLKRLEYGLYQSVVGIPKTNPEK